MEQLADAVARWAGRRGSRNLRAAFARVRPGTDSRQETRLRLLIIDAGLPEPMVNYEIRDRFGRFLALGDLVYPGWKVLVEYDGAHHFATEAQGHHDVDRLELVMADGWRVIRAHREHMPGGASGRIRAIRQALLHAGWGAS
jgi:very-short-patch-repair endonuclease